MSDVVTEPKEGVRLDLTAALLAVKYHDKLDADKDACLSEPGTVKNPTTLTLIQRITELGNEVLFTEDDFIDREEVMNLRRLGVEMEIRQHPLDPEREQVTLKTVRGKIVLN